MRKDAYVANAVLEIIKELYKIPRYFNKFISAHYIEKVMKERGRFRRPEGKTLRLVKQAIAELHEKGFVWTKYYHGGRGKKLWAKLMSPEERKGGWAEKVILYEDVPIDERHPHITKRIHRPVTKYHLPRTVVKKHRPKK